MRPNGSAVLRRIGLASRSTTPSSPSSSSPSPLLSSTTAAATSSFICPSCRIAAATSPPRRGHRSFSSASTQPPPPPSSPPPPPPSGLVSLSSRRLISVSGPDAPKFLQGAITQNVLAPTGGYRDDGFYAAFLNATGRVLHDVFVYPSHHHHGSSSSSSSTAPAAGESFLVEVDAGDAERLQRHIKRYRLRAKFDVRLLDAGEVTVWHGWGAEGDGALDSLTTTTTTTATTTTSAGSSAADPHRIAHLRDPRAPGSGYRMLSAGDREPLAAGGLGRVADEDVYRLRRYLLGVPEGPSELLREQALPLEANLDAMGGIDFRKGCYVGQELTIRTKHRGVVRKRILPVVLYDNHDGSAGAPAGGISQGLEYSPGSLSTGADAIPAETSIGRLGRKGRSAGKWLRGVGNVGLALCRLEIMTDVVLPGETAASSYTPADEFVMEQQPGEDGDGGFSVKIKAFVPGWLRQGLDQQQQQSH